MFFCKSCHLLEINGEKRKKKVLKLFSCNGVCVSAGVLYLGVFYFWLKCNACLTHGYFT